MAVEKRVPGITGIGRVCRIHARGIYRALGVEDIRRPQIASTEVLMRRLLSLDYVLEHPRLPWLPTESDKVGALEELGIERRLLPLRAYRGAAGNIRRHFRLKLPVALDAERAVFVYVDPGYKTATALRSWGAAHRGLWKALRERGRRIDGVDAPPGGGGPGADDARGRKPEWDRNPKGGPPYKHAYGEPEAKDQTNFTDPESRIMRTSTEGYQQCYNAQAVVDGGRANWWWGRR